MTGEAIKGAIAHGAAKCRKLSGCHTLLCVPDQQFAVVILNPTPTPVFDFSRCGRLSKCAAHRAINLMADTPQPLREFYHGLIDGRTSGAEAGN